MFFGVLNFKFCDLWWHAQNISKHFIQFLESTHTCIAYNALNTVYSMYFNTENTNISLRTGLIQIFGTCRILFYWFLLFLMLFNCIFCVSKFEASKRYFPWNSVFFCFLPKFCDFFSSFFCITENWGPYFIYIFFLL